MKKIKETFLKKYSVWEYIAFLGGLILFGHAIREVVLKNYESIMVVGGIALAGLVLMASPLLYVKLFNRRTGLEE